MNGFLWAAIGVAVIGTLATWLVSENIGFNSGEQGYEQSWATLIFGALVLVVTAVLFIIGFAVKLW